MTGKGEKEMDIAPARSPSVDVDEGNMAAEKQMRDIGADLYLEVRQYSREELGAERKVVLRKIDWVIMPNVDTKRVAQPSESRTSSTFCNASHTNYNASTNYDSIALQRSRYLSCYLSY
ncbi:hypothetical protein P154DRAFT_572442 [Amniculicola lignicola CBS 123094]|uniref:Uncharacterized protein n=1 Tax=Amniculicola lignicola CBS 123094 TaxID=1392246 RepID=A0A6A5WT69_9PLEO|nr:hypothetical protein P154DRAFT_572442 [Amniculicola lignicola CBS 123094]